MYLYSRRKILVIIFVMMIIILLASDLFAHSFTFYGPHYSSYSRHFVIFNPYLSFYNIKLYYGIHSHPSIYYYQQIPLYTVTIRTPKIVTKNLSIKKKDNKYHSYIFER
jgi:hypothetical protein